MKWTLSSLSLAMAAVLANAAPVDYLRVVKPIFAEHCYRCHGASQQKGELRMDTAALALKGGENGPAYVAGKSSASLLVQAIKGTHDSISRMPYKKPPLSEAQIALIARWIDEGAPAPRDEKPEENLHWAFVPPKPPEVPRIAGAEGINPIDAFIRVRLQKEGVEPAPEADRITLIRRLSLDLIGLPPSVAEVDEFLKDTRPDAYERLVERLLASPHYGERWGRHWLDVARYADSNGYSIDAPRSIWKYRDWVINALNRDMPFDQFVIEQLAGDLLPDAALNQKIATGFHRNTQVNQEGGIDPEQFRVESVMDRVNTTGTAFLGLTIGCAQCHDHKFDPITQREYYQLYAFFNSTIEDGHGKGAPSGMLEIPGETEGGESLEKELEEAGAELERYLDTKGSEVTKWEAALTEEEREELKLAVRSAIRHPWSERNLEEKRAVYAAFKPEDPEFKSRHANVTKLQKRKPKPITTLVMRELETPRETVVFIKGDFTRPGDKVRPGVPAILNPLPFESGSDSNALPTRLDLGRWIVDPANPLTARVMVNRIWQHYFGRGLVETENDFGTQGTPPSHPELLDWLACEFRQPTIAASRQSPADKTETENSTRPTSRDGKPWSLKHIHRLIVTSATYRQSSRVRPELVTIDPNNKLLARQSRLRLDAEIVRDVGLAASGLLNPMIGGPGVFPPQPDGVMTLGQVKRTWKASTGPDRYRRGMYTFHWRATPHPALAVFDSPDGFSACTRRLRSNTPLQALTVLNDEAFNEFAQALAERILALEANSDRERIAFAFRQCLSRKPGAEESERLRQLLEKELAALEKAPDEAAAIIDRKPKPGEDIVQLAAWTTVSRVLLNLDETITRE